MRAEMQDVGENEVRTVLQSIRRAQDRAIIALIANSGLRPGEITQLNLNSIQILESPHVGIGWVQGKRGGQREFFVDPVALRYLNEWTAERGGRSSEPLFVDSRHRRLNSASIVRRLRRWSKRLGIAGLGGRLRCLFFVRLFIFGMTPSVVKRLGGYMDEISTPREVMIGQYLAALAHAQNPE
jgi:integrase